MGAAGSISKLYHTDKTTNQIISALNAGKKVLIILDNESIFNIVQATSYAKIESLIDETQIQYRLYFTDNNVPLTLSSQALQDPFILNQNTPGI